MTCVLSPEAWESLRKQFKIKDELLSRHLCPHCGGLGYEDTTGINEVYEAARDRQLGSK